MQERITSIAKRITRPLVRIDAVWELLRRMPRHEFFLHVRRSVVGKSIRGKIAGMLSSLQVQQGHFAGLKYAETSSVGSTLWPKLMGTYESELDACWDTILAGRYRSVIDVGYAEGFYLIGLGRKLPLARLIGFDVEPEAERLCRLNAQVNGIDAGRLTLMGGFNAADFRRVLDHDSLVVVDCEGLENEVIRSVDPSRLGQADWLIETHDHLVHGTAADLRARLAATHDVIEIPTDDDFRKKCKLLPSDVQRVCNRYEQEALVNEGRLSKQSWIFAKRRAA